MAITVPSTNIQFFSDLGLSPSYENTLYFESEAAKDAYFNGLTKRAAFMSCTYQRENRGYIRVQCNISLLYNVDYMRFQNPDFENKWFYAFVTEVNYINNTTTEVQYQMDVMMTWMGNFNLKRCYVERQHVRNDNIGANIADEGLPTGEYIIEKSYKTVKTGKDDMYIVIVYMPDTGQGHYFGGIYSGCALRICSTTDEANNFINDMIAVNRSDSIVSIFMAPKEFFTNTAEVTMKSYAIEKPYTDVGGYVPRNKKLFCYPYKYCEVDNMEGQSQIFLYEYFETLPDETSSGLYQLTIIGTVTSNCNLILYPVQYKGSTGQTNLNDPDAPYKPPLKALSMTHFPMCSWGVDAYKAWVAQKNAYFPVESREKVGNGIIGNTASGFVSGGMQAINTGATFKEAAGVGALVGATQGALSGVVNTSNAIYNNLLYNNTSVISPDISKGEQSTDALTGSGQKTFVVYEKCITKNYAKMIDDYFTMYGYAVKQVLVPSMNVRSHYTFVKTIGCNVGGNLPASDARAIEQIFDNGVRFWKNHTEIGDYSLDNSGVVG